MGIEVLSKITKLLEKYMPENKDQEMFHVEQVLVFSRSLFQQLQESKDLILAEEIVIFTAIIHDIGRYIPVQKKHTEIELEDVLLYIDIPFPGRDRVKIIKAIQRHNTSSEEKPSSLLEKIIFDADHLSVFTPFGIARWYHKAESWGNRNLKGATEDLKALLDQAEQGSLFYLKESQQLFEKHGCPEFIHNIERQLKLP